MRRYERDGLSDLSLMLVSLNVPEEMADEVRSKSCKFISSSRAAGCGFTGHAAGRRAAIIANFPP